MKLFVLTHNPSKLKEISEILKEYGIEVLHMEGEKREIQSDNIEEIALNAAKDACSSQSVPIVVDDTALYIEALNGFPGPYAEYVYRTIGLRGILKLLEKEENRKAWFATAVVYCDGNIVKIFKGILEGSIAEEIRGNYGFGFDPIFIPIGQKKTLAEMLPEEKNKISHRSKAFRELAQWLVSEKTKLNKSQS
ncbi:MAG: XTP/dITP diphosphatase [Fervidicoccaceae archaeon]